MKRLSVVAVVVAALAGVARAAFLVVSVEGESMIPTYRPGDAVLVARRWIASPVHPGDVVLCRLPRTVPGPGGYLVKRVSSVVSGHIVLHGDGPRSYDSRAFGPIPVECVLGRVVTRLTPPGGASKEA